MDITANNKRTEEIEKAIQEAETDNSKASLDSAVSSNNKSSTKPTKRSALVSTDTVSGVPIKKRAGSGSKTPHLPEMIVDNIEQNEPKQTYGISDVHIITTDFLQRLIAYAEYVKQKKEIYKNMPVQNRKKDNIELLIAKKPKEKLIGIKFNYETPPSLDNEYEYAQYEKSKAETILSFKTLVEDGLHQPEDAPHMFVTNLGFDGNDVTNAVELDMNKRKNDKDLWLKTECNLIETDAKIKDCLGLDKADPKQALEYLDNILHLHIETLMLKKHPSVVDMVRRVRTYIGNVKGWNLTDKQLETFQADAARLRNKADDVYLKFITIFNARNETEFWNDFCGHVQTFREQTKDMCINYIHALTAEPLSRLAFFDAMDEAEEMKLLVSQLESDVDQISVISDSNPVS
ncbi:hypothetical protein ILUMI_18919 [Ignelater luminosus]|uniref:Lens epithelium-derived growth factor integrase-binding domain-containing protein n=1 Tax=Ignelater luminosus TaxID=2038154 RepID=A0A8K0CJ19_IGNLU|nr:hypothetical protein ILUMI_18919 [Ignelater luminosus]